jgi:hypothetical protein
MYRMDKITTGVSYGFAEQTEDSGADQLLA